MSTVQEPLEGELVVESHQLVPIGDEKPLESNGKLIAAEEVAVGHIRLSARRSHFCSFGDARLTIPPLVKLFFGNIGGVTTSIAFIVSILVLESIGQFCGVMETWSLGLWTKQYNLHPPSEIPVL